METEVELEAQPTSEEPKSTLTESQKLFFDKCTFRKERSSHSKEDISVEDIESTNEQEEESTTDNVCKTKACLDELRSLRTIIQAQAKKIELLEEKLSQVNINQDEEDPDGVENKNKKRKRDISGIQSIMNASIIEDSSNKDIEISALNEENKLMKEEINQLKKKKNTEENPLKTNAENSTPNILTLIKDLQTSIDKRFSDMHELITEKKKEDDNPNSKVASSVTYANIIGESQSESTPTSFRAIMMATKNEELAEEAEKKRRECNLIIHGKEENGDDDKLFVQNLNKQISVGSVKINQIMRVGEIKANKIRPLKVVLSSPDEKNKVLYSMKNLKGNELYKGISVTDDYTINEREMIREFVKKAKKENEKEDKESNYIWRVRGCPKNGLTIKRLTKFPQKTNQIAQ